MTPPTLPDDPRVSRLLLALWDAHLLEGGLLVAGLPDELRDAAVVVFAVNSHYCYLASKRYRLLEKWEASYDPDNILEMVFEEWEAVTIDPRDTLASMIWKAIQTGDTSDHYLRLTPQGEELAARLALHRSASKTAPPEVAQPKKANQEDGAQVKLVAKLLEHHRYPNEHLNLNPIGVRKLAKGAEVSSSTASTFFKNIGTLEKYQQACEDKKTLARFLKRLDDSYP